MKRFLRLGEKLSTLSICGHNISDFSIVIDARTELISINCALPTVTKAADILQKYIHSITDIFVPIYFDIYPTRAKHEILIGGTNHEYDPLKDEKFDDEDYAIKTNNGHLSINGGKRGLLYGVYAFLEMLGVRFFSKTCEKILYQECIEIGDLDVVHHAVFEYRDYCDWTGFDPDFSVKSRVNGSFARNMRPEDGDAVGFAGGFAGLCHTFGPLLPPTVYFKEHPEWFALMEDGTRDPGGFCVYNEEMQAELLENCKKWLRKETDPKIISVSINDGEASYCRCEKCKAVLDKGGNDTDNIIYLVNKMQEGLREEFPTVSVETLSYGQVNTFPAFVKPVEGVVVRVCGMGVGKTSIAEAMEKYGETGTNNAIIRDKLEFAQRIKQWGQYTDKIYVWDYPYSYTTTSTPFPVLHSVWSTMRYYADHKVKGVYINGNADSAGFPELKFYLISKCMDNPYMSKECFEKHFDEFLEGYYGLGWKYVKEYIEYCEEICNEFGGMMQPQKVIPISQDENGRYDETFFRKGGELFAKAKAMADGYGEWKRLHKASLEVEFYEMWLTMDWHMDNAKDEAERTFWTERHKRLCEDLTKVGVQRIGERIFLPVIKNYAQSPQEHDYWDFECVVGDRNNEIYSREVYVMIPFDEPLGTKIDFECFYITNNENENGYLSVANQKGFVRNDINPMWKDFRKHKKIVLRGGEVMSKEQFVAQSGLPANGLMLKFLPIHKNGIILRIDEMDAGAYLFVKNVKIIGKEEA